MSIRLPVIRSIIFSLFSFNNIFSESSLLTVSSQVKVLFLILVDLCRRTAPLQHPLPASQVGANQINIRLHYIDGNYTVLPEVVEASLGPHMQVWFILNFPAYWC